MLGHHVALASPAASMKIGGIGAQRKCGFKLEVVLVESVSQQPFPLLACQFVLAESEPAFSLPSSHRLPLIKLVLAVQLRDEHLCAFPDKGQLVSVGGISMGFEVPYMNVCFAVDANEL